VIESLHCAAHIVPWRGEAFRLASQSALPPARGAPSRIVLLAAGLPHGPAHAACSLEVLLLQCGQAAHVRKSSAWPLVFCWCCAGLAGLQAPALRADFGVGVLRRRRARPSGPALGAEADLIFTCHSMCVHSRSTASNIVAGGFAQLLPDLRPQTEQKKVSPT